MAPLVSAACSGSVDKKFASGAAEARRADHKGCPGPFIQQGSPMSVALTKSKTEGVSHVASVVYLVGGDSCGEETLEDLLSRASVEVFRFRSAREFLQHQRTDAAACLILDLELPDASGLDLQQRISQESGPPVIFITGVRDVESTVRAMKAGAMEFFTKPINGAALLAAIESAFIEDQRLRERNARLMMLQRRFGLLTPREGEVFPLVISGLRNKQAAWKLGISEVTLQVHRGQIMRKMAATSFAELVRMGDQLNISSHTPASRPQKAPIQGNWALA